MKTFENSEFGISKAYLSKMFFSKTEQYTKWLEKIGGIQALAKLLKSDLKEGISDLDKTSTFFRKKVLDTENSSRKLTDNDYHLFTSIFHALIYFLLSFLKARAMDLFQSLGFFIIALFSLVSAFLSFNKYQLRPKNSSQENIHYNVLRKGVEITLLFKELLIGDILFLEPGHHLGLISGILLEGELEIHTKENTNPKIIKQNDRIFQESNVLSGKGLLLICILGPKTQEQIMICSELDNLSKLLYNLEENSGVLARLLAWITTMIIIIHCYFAGKMDDLSFLDLLIVDLIICLIVYPIRLIWIMNMLNSTYKRNLYDEYGIKIQNINALSEISHIILETEEFIEEKILCVKFFANNCKIYEINEFNSSNGLLGLKEKIIRSLFAVIQQEKSLMTKTEKSLSEFLCFLMNEENYIEFEKSVFPVKEKESEKNYKTVEDSGGLIHKIGQYEDIIEECELQINNGKKSLLDKSQQDHLYLEMQSKDVHKILALSVRFNGKTTFIGLFGFINSFHENKHIKSIEKLNKMNVNLILLSEENHNYCKNLQEKLGISSIYIKDNEEVLNEIDQDFQSSCIISQTNQMTKLKLIKLLKDNGNSVMLSIKSSDYLFYNLNDPSFILMSSENIQVNSSIILKENSLEGLTKALIFSQFICLSLKNCLFSKIVISVTLVSRLILSVCINLKPFLDIFQLLWIFLILEVFLLVWVHFSKDFSENIKNKKTFNSYFLIRENDIKKVACFVLISVIVTFMAELVLNPKVTALIMGIIAICACNRNINKKQIILISFSCVLVGYLIL